MIESYVINILHMHLCLIDNQMIIKISNPVEAVDGWHLYFMGA